MKTYKIVVDGRKGVLLGLTQDVKADILDTVVVEKSRANDRRLANGRITPVEHKATAGLIQGFTFISHAVADFMVTPEGMEATARAMLVWDDGKDVTDEDVAAVMRDQAVAGTTTHSAFSRMFGDAYPAEEADPKAGAAKTTSPGAPSLPPTQTDGAAVSPESPST